MARDWLRKCKRNGIDLPALVNGERSKPLCLDEKVGWVTSKESTI